LALKGKHKGNFFKPLCDGIWSFQPERDLSQKFYDVVVALNETPIGHGVIIKIGQIKTFKNG
jgi:hypothetical protein